MGAKSTSAAADPRYKKDGAEDPESDGISDTADPKREATSAMETKNQARMRGIKEIGVFFWTNMGSPFCSGTVTALVVTMIFVLLVPHLLGYGINEYTFNSY